MKHGYEITTGADRINILRKISHIKMAISEERSMIHINWTKIVGYVNCMNEKICYRESPECNFILYNRKIIRKNKIISLYLQHSSLYHALLKEYYKLLRYLESLL